MALISVMAEGGVEVPVGEAAEVCVELGWPELAWVELVRVEGAVPAGAEARPELREWAGAEPGAEEVLPVGEADAVVAACAGVGGDPPEAGAVPGAGPSSPAGAVGCAGGEERVRVRHPDPDAGVGHRPDGPERPADAAGAEPDPAGGAPDSAAVPATAEPPAPPGEASSARAGEARAARNAHAASSSAAPTSSRTSSDGRRASAVLSGWAPGGRPGRGQPA